MAPKARELWLTEAPFGARRVDRRAKKALNLRGVMDGARFCLVLRAGGGRGGEERPVVPGLD